MKQVSRKFQTTVNYQVHADHLQSIIDKHEMSRADYLRQVILLIRLMDNHGITVHRMIESVGNIVECILKSLPGKEETK